MQSLRLASVNLMTSLYVTLNCHNMADVCNRSDCIFKNPHSEMKGMQEKIHHWCEG